MKRPHLPRRTITILIVAVLVLAMVPVAFAATRALSKIFPDTVNYWGKDSIEKVADAGIMKGSTDGNFYPDRNLTRGEQAVTLDRMMTWTTNEITSTVAAEVTSTVAAELTKDNVMRRGCTACHAIVNATTGAYGLAYEAKNAYAGHPFAATDNKTYQDCMVCHASKTNGLGVGAGISMRDIVHPVHMNSGIYVGEFRGNCFNCHNVDYNNVFQILPVKVDTSDDGIPSTLPIGSAVNPIPAVP